MLIRLEALELAANAAKSEVGMRHPLDFIRVEENGTVVATDGHHFLRLTSTPIEPTLFDAELPKPETEARINVLVNAEDAKAFKVACKRAARKEKRDPSQPIHVAVARVGDAATLATTDGLTVRRFEMKDGGPELEEKYPDLDRTVPVGPKREITFSVELLQRILRTLHALRCRSVTLGIVEDDHAAVVISAMSLAGAIDGVVMPIRVD